MKKIAPLMLIAAGCLWGTTGVFVRRLGALGLSSLALVELRSLITSAVLLVGLLIFGRGLLKVRLRDLPIFAGGGILSVLFFNFCYFKAIDMMSLSVAAILLYTAPIFVTIMSAMFFHEKLTRRKLLSVALAFCGCALVSGIFSGGAAFSLPGILLGLGAGFGYALYSFFSRLAINRGYSSFTITFYTFIFSALGGAFLVDFSEIGRVFYVSDSSLLLDLFLYAVITTVPSYLLYTFGLLYVENSTASVIVSIEPVVAALCGFFFFGEKPSLPAFVGMALVLSSLVLLNLSLAPKDKIPKRDQLTK